MKAQYQVLPPTAPVPAPNDVLEETAREGARRLLQAMLEAEVDEYLGRSRYQRSGDFRGYRNGRLPARTVGVGMGAVEIRSPRVSDVPEGAAPFGSESVERYERRSKTQQRLLARLYLEGLSSGDFEPVFRALVGGTAALSPTSILRLREEWEMEYRAWRDRPLASRYVYIYADGVYLKAGLEREKTALLVVIGVRADGIKELLAMNEGYRESMESWLAVLRWLRDRGMAEAPLAAVGDGGLGFWAALDEVFPTTRHLRCWNHKRLNVLDKLPRRLHKEAGAVLSALYMAPSRAECTRLRDAYAAQLRAQGQAQAAECLERDWEAMVAFYDFPQEHWQHLKTSNPIESVFDGVKLRTNGTKRMRVRENALYLVFKLVCRLSTNWRSINAPNQLALLLDGHAFVDGKLHLPHATQEDQAA
jgi:transposase-like protein